MELQEQISSYKILELLGRGGMGAVYKGWQVSLERYVAIKILPPGMDDGDTQFVARFKQEAKTMAKFHHPGIVAVHDAGETVSGVLYIVMEFVEGTDVAQMVKSQGRLPADHALAITAHVCDALQYAHSRGVIHRDIKPANVMLNTEGHVKVADFGLAKATGSAQRGLTRSDMSMGTPDYIAPEALMLGVVADHRADLYAVGVMLYNMLTGEIPRGMFRMPSQKVGADPRFDDIIRKAMEEERDHRYQSATEIRRDLDVVLSAPIPKEEETPPPPPAPPPPSAPARKPVARGPQRREMQATAPQPDAKAALSPSKRQKPPHKKSGAGMMGGIIGIAAVVVGAMILWAPWKHTSSAGQDDAFIREVAALPAEDQVERVAAKLKELNPGFDGAESHEVKDSEVTKFSISAKDIRDISPVRALTDLHVLRANYLDGKSKLSDLSPLKGLKPSKLDFQNTDVSDLAPLQGMPLEVLILHGTSVHDLSSLSGMPLDDLKIGTTKVTDLSPLRGMPLHTLHCQVTGIDDLSPLEGLPLTDLDCDNTKVQSLSPLRGMKLEKLDIISTRVTDLSPLLGVPLQEIVLDFVPARDMEILRSIKTLQKINGKPAAEFLKQSGNGAQPATKLRSAPTTSFPPKPKQWEDLMPEGRLLIKKGDAVEKDGGISFTRDYVGLRASSPTLNGVLRAVASGAVPKAVLLAGKKGVDYRMIGTDHEMSIEARTVADGHTSSWTKLGLFSCPDKVDIQRDNEYVFAAIRDRLRVWINQTLVAEVKNETPQERVFSVELTPGAVLKKCEFGVLSAAAASAASAPAAPEK